MVNVASLKRAVAIPSDAATGSLRRPIMSARPNGLCSRLRWPTNTTNATPAHRNQNPFDDSDRALAATPDGPPVNDANRSVSPATTSAYINVTTATANGPRRRAGNDVTAPTAPHTTAASAVAKMGLRCQCTWLSATV